MVLFYAIKLSQKLEIAKYFACYFSSKAFKYCDNGDYQQVKHYGEIDDFCVGLVQQSIWGWNSPFF